jgi:hypothetical protein
MHLDDKGPRYDLVREFMEISEQKLLPEPVHQPVMNWTAALLSALHSNESQAALRSGTWLTERDFVQYLLDSVNAGRITRQRWASWVSGAELPGSDDASVAIDSDAALWLEQIVSDLPKARRAMRARWESAVNGKLILIPRLDSRGVTYREIAGSLGVAMGYAFVLLLDPTKPFGKDLCRCGYSKCQKFFFVQKVPGVTRVRRRSCSAEHAVLMDAEDAANRMARLRTKRRRKAK